jgi:hypothetical protein
MVGGQAQMGMITPGPFNSFSRAARLAGPDDRFVSINDTIYSIAQVDVSGGPALLRVPDTAGRYYVLQFVDAWTNNFAYVGRRATGTAAGSFLLTPPRWDGNGGEEQHRCYDDTAAQCAQFCARFVRGPVVPSRPASSSEYTRPSVPGLAVEMNGPGSVGASDLLRSRAVAAAPAHPTVAVTRESSSMSTRLLPSRSLMMCRTVQPVSAAGPPVRQRPR